MRAYQIGFVTARGFHPKAREITLRRLAERDLVPDHLLITSHGEKKSDHIRTLGRLVAYVDDHVDHLHALQAAGLVDHLCVFDMPWNRHNQNYRRFKSTAEFAQMVNWLPVAESPARPRYT